MLISIASLCKLFTKAPTFQNCTGSDTLSAVEVHQHFLPALRGVDLGNGTYRPGGNMLQQVLRIWGNKKTSVCHCIVKKRERGLLPAKGGMQRAVPQSLGPIPTTAQGSSPLCLYLPAGSLVAAAFSPELTHLCVRCLREKIQAKIFHQ